MYSMCSSHAHTHVLLLVLCITFKMTLSSHTHSYVLPLQVEKREEDSSLMQLKEEVRGREREGAPSKPNTVAIQSLPL